jgi:Berberine and berberine like
LDTTVGFLNSPEGVPLVGVVVVYAGAVEDGQRVLEPLRKFGPPVADLVQPMMYTEVQSMLDQAVPMGDRYYWKSNFLNELSPGLARVLTDGANAMASPQSMILVFEIKGKIQQVPKEAMAFEHRDANFEMSIIAHWTDTQQDQANMRWARDVWTAAQPFVSDAVYSNHMTADEPQKRIESAYGAEKYKKLARLKKKYDPENFFKLNHNITPESS